MPKMFKQPGVLPQNGPNTLISLNIKRLSMGIFLSKITLEENGN